MALNGDEVGARFRVEGRVQGVGFRDWTRRRARTLGLVGWVKNLSDGTVEVGARGSAEAVAALEKELGEGPPAASVKAVERLGKIDDVPEGKFEIRF